MFLLLKLCVVFSLVLTAVLCFQLWPHRKLLLPRILLVNMFFYFLWAFWVVMTLLTEDHDFRIILTKIRQVTTPFIGSTWLVMSIALFYRPLWDRYKKWFSLLYLIPLMTAVCSVLSILNIKVAEQLVAMNFQEIPFGGGLLSYELGPLLKLQFISAGAILVLAYGCYVVNLFSPSEYMRKYAMLLTIGGALPMVMEWVGRFYVDTSLVIQMNSGLSWTLVLVIYYGVTRFEFLNIKSFAQQRVFENLPNPVLTLTPRMEIWDANLAARKIFEIEDDHLGSSILGDTKFDFVVHQPDKIIRFGKTYQLITHEIQLRGAGSKGTVIVLSDITEITELNAEMEAHNRTLKDLNTEIWRITSFNQKIQTVLSHDMTGVLASIHSLAKAGIEGNSYMQKILWASSSSLDLLKNILSWSHEEKNIELVAVSRSMQTVLSQLSSQILDKNIEIAIPSLEKDFFIQGSANMIETVMRNVLSNAIKYSPHESTVLVSLLEVENHVEIKITDSGKGMSPEDIENIMSNKPVTGDRHGGYGVGLRFTLEFVEKLTGRFNIESEFGKGTTVKMNFPLHRT